jgi:aminopeptidase YwaD
MKVTNIRNILKRILLANALLVLFINANSQDIEYAKNIIDTLSSSYMAGRGYLDDGDLKAASFIAAEYKYYNLNMYQNSYFQNFNISVNTFPEVVSLKIDGLELKPGIDFIVDPCSPKFNGIYTTVALKKAWIADDTQLLNILKKHAGKVLIIDEEKLKLNAREANILARKIKNSKLEIAGIILLTNQKLIWSVSPFECPIPQITVRKQSVNSHKSVQVQIDQAHINKYKTQNVIGFIPGTKQPDSIIVYSAHYDHLGKMGEKTMFPGANDNASGIAMMLNLARHYSEEPPPFTVVFMAFGAEEIGLVGSRYFVDNPLFLLKNIKFLINLDMVGTGDDGLGVVNGTIFQDHFKVLSSINDAHRFLPQLRQRGESCNSDHCFFYSKGVPSFFFYTMGGSQAYHDITDVPGTLPLTKYNETFKLIVLFSEYLMGMNYN